MGTLSPASASASTAPSAATSSPAEAKRFSGGFSRQRRMIASTASGIAGATVRGGGGGTVTCFVTASPIVRTWKGGKPVATS